MLHYYYSDVVLRIQLILKNTNLLKICIYKLHPPVTSIIYVLHNSV